MKSPQESFRIDYFFYIVDKAIISLQNRFEQFQIYKDIFYLVLKNKVIGLCAFERKMSKY